MSTAKHLTKTELDAVRVSLREGASLMSVVDPAAKPVPTTSKAVDFPPVPATPEITPEVRQALRDLPKVYGQVVVEEPRVLGASEVVSLHDEFTTLQQIGDTLTRRLEVVKEYVRSHVDAAALQDGVDVKKTPRDKAGHFILASKGNPTRVNIDGTNKAFSLEYRSGRAGTSTISSDRLLDMYEQGEISREDYLSVTRERRVFDEDKATAAILAKPELLGVIRSAMVTTGQTDPGTNLYLRTKK